MLRKKNLIFFLMLFIVLSVELGPILKVLCSNDFLFWHYCLFCTVAGAHQPESLNTESNATAELKHVSALPKPLTSCELN